MILNRYTTNKTVREIPSESYMVKRFMLHEVLTAVVSNYLYTEQMTSAFLEKTYLTFVHF